MIIIIKGNQLTAILDAHIHISSLDDFFHPENYYFLNATHEKNWDLVLAKAELNEKITPFIGIHPWFVPTVKPGWQNKLVALLKEYPRCGVGEIGLDRVKGQSNFNAQMELFTSQLLIAREFQRPVSIHCVHSFDVLFHILKKNQLTHLQGILHRFEAGVEVVKRLLSLGFSISFYYNLHEREKLKSAFLSCPTDKIFLESDAGEGADDSALLDHYQKTSKLLNIDNNCLIRMIRNNGEIFTDTAFNR